MGEACLRNLRFLFNHVKYMIAIAGTPCTDLTALKAGRQGLKGKASRLLCEFIRVLKLLKLTFPETKVDFLVENVQSMDWGRGETHKQFDELLGVSAVAMNCAGIVDVRRPRYYWASFPLDTKNVKTGNLENGVLEITLEGEQPLETQWLRARTVKNEPIDIYPTFARAVKRDKPPRTPAGLYKASDEARERWRLDGFR